MTVNFTQGVRMRMLILFILLALASPAMADAQTIVTPTAQEGVVSTTFTLTSSISTGPFISLIGSGVSAHKFTWNAVDDVSAGAVKMQKCTSALSATCTDLIGAQTVTSSGGPTTLQFGIVNYVRFLASTPITGAGSVVARYYGYVEPVSFDGSADTVTVVGLTDGATPALDASTGDVFTLIAAGNRTIGIPSNPTSGQKIVIVHTASGADRTLALNTGTGGFRFGTDITALTATTSAKTDYIGAIYNAVANKWDVIAYSKGF